MKPLIKEKNLTILGCMLIAVAILIGILSKNNLLLDLDLSFSMFFQKTQPHWFVTINYIISFCEILFFPLIPAIFILLFKSRKYPELIVFICLIALLLLGVILKHIFDVPRPDIEVITPYYKDYTISIINSTSTKGFPSTHVLNYTLIFGTIIFFIRKSNSKRYLMKITAYFIPTVLIATIGISRISLGAHYLSQVVGGYLFGIGFVFMLRSLYYNRLSKTHPLL